MSLNVTVTGTPILEGIPPSSISAQMRADDGDAGFGGFLIDDPDATVSTTGHKLLVIEETACSQPRIFTGYLTERQISRSEDRALVAGDDARLHEVGAIDLNSVFHFRIITTTGGKRPQETMEDRLTWLLGYQALSVFVEDTGFVEYYPQMMDEADYTGATPAAVLDDLVGRLPDPILTYFAFWDPVAGAVGLYFGPESDGIGESTLSISNDLDDINGTTIFAPDYEAKLRRSPEEVYSEVICEYLHGTKRVYRKRPGTATAYVARGTTIQRPYTGRLTTAQNQADRWLTKHSFEQDEITVAIIVPPASAGLALAGQRLNVKFTHLPGYSSWSSMRIVTSTVTPTDDTATQYRLELVLRLPVDTAWPPAGPCEDETPTASQSFAPLNDSGDSTLTGELTYSVAGQAHPLEASPSWDGRLIFPTYGTGGTPDYGEAAYWFENHIRIHVVGPGSLTIDTSQISRGGYDPSDDNRYEVNLGPRGVADAEDQLANAITFGDSVTVTVPDDGHCAHWVEITGDNYDTPNNTNCGFVGATWVAGAVDDEEDQGSTPTNPVTSTADPTVDDDANDGYSVGQTWVNTSTGAVFVLTDSTVGAAIWTPTSGGGSQPPVVVVVDGGGEAITSGAAVMLPLTSNGEFTAWTIVADQSGSIAFDLQIDSYANFPPDSGDSIVAAAPPSITGAAKGTDSTLSGWTTAYSSGDVLRVVVSSATTVEHVTLTLERT